MAEPAPPAHPQPPRPPPSSNSHQLPPHPAAAHKRMLEVEEFKQTSYYKIRAIVRDLRASFLEACRAPDLQNSKAVDEIKKKLKSVAELYRHVGLERASSRSLHTSSAFVQDFYKQQHQQQQQVPSQAKADYKQKTNLPSETLQHNLNTTEVVSSISTQPSSGPRPPRTAPTPAAAAPTPAATAAAAATPTTTASNTIQPGVVGVEQLLGGDAANKGTYVVGGSPLGWNFVAYHTSATPVYGGVSKAEWLAKRASVAAAAATATAATTITAAASSATTTATTTITAAASSATTTATTTITAAASSAATTATTTITAAASSADTEATAK